MPCAGRYIHAYEMLLLFSSCFVCRQVYLCVPGDNNIVQVDLDGQNSTIILRHLDGPIGIAIDHLHSRMCWISFGKYKGGSDL